MCGRDDALAEPDHDLSGEIDGTGAAHPEGEHALTLLVPLRETLFRDVLE